MRFYLSAQTRHLLWWTVILTSTGEWVLIELSTSISRVTRSLLVAIESPETRWHRSALAPPRVKRYSCLVGVVGIAHGACAHNTLFYACFSAPALSKQGHYPSPEPESKSFYPIAFAAAVAIDTAMTTTLVDVHVVVVAKPQVTFGVAGDDCLCGNELHIESPFPSGQPQASPRGATAQ